MNRPARIASALAALVLAVSLAACGDNSAPEPSPSPPQGNLFLNAGFEEGDSPWLAHTTAVNPDPAVRFARSEERAHSGAASAHFLMRDPAEAADAKVYYLVQEVSPEQFPEVVRGFYRVENWTKGTPKQYLQFVVIVFGPTNFPTTSNNWQIRYILAGVDSPPFPIGNARFVFISREEPVQNEWVPFETNIKEDFQRIWGAVPAGFEKIRLLFEVRWDGKVAGDGAPAADVYYDDLYVGSAAE